MISDEELNASAAIAANGNELADAPAAEPVVAEVPTELISEVGPTPDLLEPDARSEGMPRASGPKRTRASKPRRDRKKTERPKRPNSAMFRRFVSIVWSGRREPVDDMFWVEAEREGDWIVIREFEQVRSRKEILDRLLELPSGLVAVDFNLSYPQDFVEFVKGETGIEDWRGLVKKVREDLKKNADDGVRLWIERMGKYRESRLDPEPPRFARREPERRDRFSNDRRDRFANDRFASERRVEPLPPYEQRSIAERFRRTDLAMRRAAEQHLVSPIQIAYNRLTNRYEFSDASARGRAALLGLSMFDQLLDARPEVAVWPMMRPKELTIVEMLPWTFTSGKTMEAGALRKMLAVHEDNGWDIPEHAVDLAARNPDAQRALLCLLGMIKTETRENRERRPIRDYVDAFYHDPQVKVEGWFYSIGYRVSDEQKGPQHHPETHEEQPSAGREEQPRTPRPPVEENPIVAEAPAETIEQLPTPEAAEIVAAE